MLHTFINGNCVKILYKWHVFYEQKAKYRVKEKRSTRLCGESEKEEEIK